MQPALIKHDVPPDEIARKPTFGKSIEYCAELAGYSFDKVLEDRLAAAGCKIDKTQISRWGSGTEGIRWEKLHAVMRVCGNDAPLHWMVYQMGYDLHSLRPIESETQRENRLLREENQALRRVLMAGGK